MIKVRFNEDGEIPEDFSIDFGKNKFWDFIKINGGLNNGRKI